MLSLSKKTKLILRWIPVSLAVIVLAVMTVLMNSGAKRMIIRGADQPPVITFTWSPAGAVDLKELRGLVTIKDDYALDFTTYRMRLVELEKTLDMPIPGMIGKEYEQPVSFGLIAEEPGMYGRSKLTVEISIADDKGQKATLTRSIDIQPQGTEVR